MAKKHDEKDGKNRSNAGTADGAQNLDANGDGEVAEGAADASSAAPPVTMENVCEVVAKLRAELENHAPTPKQPPQWEGDPPECLGIGRIVHYVLDNGTVAPAIVMSRDEKFGYARLFVMVNGIPRFTNIIAGAVPFDRDGTRAPRTWHWPERE